MEGRKLASTEINFNSKCSAASLVRARWRSEDRPQNVLAAQNAPRMNSSAARTVPGTSGLSRDAKIRDFLRRVDRGEFSGKDVQVHMDSNGDIAKALMSGIPMSHWASWAFNIKQKPDGRYVKTYFLETKSGKAVKIVLDE
jgi:hypothetical protein